MDIITVLLLRKLKNSYMTRVKKFFNRLPHLLGMGFVVFLSLFAFDVFSEYSGLSAILPFLIHLMPSFILLLFVGIAWRYEWVGAIIFLGFALLYIWSVGFERPISWYLAISLPSAIAGMLYLINWIKKRNLHTNCE